MEDRWDPIYIFLFSFLQVTSFPKTINSDVSKEVYKPATSALIFFGGGGGGLTDFWPFFSRFFF
jgi:hypothetical protein